MKKYTYIWTFIVLLMCTIQVMPSYANANETEHVLISKTERYIQYVYDKIKFGKFQKLSFEAFHAAMYGYLNLLEAGKISSNALLSVCDFTLSSNKKRFWVIDIKHKKILYHTLVAHGMGTGEEFATKFSNIHDSHQSSLGFYITAETYEGNNGYSLKLQGIDGVFNNNAYDRAIVIHGADYVSEQFARDNQRLGRSHGCPALPQDIAPKIIDKIKEGHCLFIYHSDKNYLKKSVWLNQSIKHLPEEADKMDLLIPSKNNDILNNNTTAKQDKKEESVTGDTQEITETTIKQPIQSTLDKKPIVYHAAKDIPANKKVTYVIIHENTKTGVSDTSIVK